MRDISLSDFSIAAAVNDERILNDCLAASEVVRQATMTLRTYRDYPNASSAYNDALSESKASMVILAHQDVYLPRSFPEYLISAVNELTKIDEDWAVMGVIGIDRNRDVHGQTWSTAQNRTVGNPINTPRVVESLDELLVVIRNNGELRFDEELPSFHLFGLDIVQTAKLQGRKSYAVHLPVVHHSRPLTNLGGGYRTAYRYCQRKWAEDLPIPNLMGDLESSILPLTKRDIRLRLANRGRVDRGDLRGSAETVAQRLGLE